MEKYSSRKSPRTFRNITIGVAFALFLIVLASMFPRASHPSDPNSRPADPHSKSSGPTINLMGSTTPSEKTTYVFQKPEGIKIKGVVFYGRARFVDILDCYLQKNLAVNGGLLDEVLFMENTDNKDDIEYLHKLVAKVPQYTRVPVERPNDQHGWGGFNVMWTKLQEDKTIYLKVDDDIVWVHEDAVPRMIETLLKHPEAHDIAGNIINSPLTNFMHFHNDAVHPYLPEMKEPAVKSDPNDWRVNNLPMYSDEEPDEYDFEPTDNKMDREFKIGSKGGPPFEGHRWLPLMNDSAHLWKTPIQKAAYDAFGRGWKSWAIGAQQHYSLFRNIENGWLSRYWFGNGEGIWNMQYGRYNLNFLAIWGSSVRMELPGPDDEDALTVSIPLKFKRPCLVDTHALIAHFNFGTQPEIGHTDLLNRYRAYANEFICAANNQKVPFP